MKKIWLLLLLPAFAASCTKCHEPVACTQEFRMITLQLKSPTDQPVVLDSSYTIRASGNEKIYPDQPMGGGYYVVLDDLYHPKLKNSEDEFRFIGWKNNAMVVNQVYRIAGDECHITKRSGADSVLVP